MADIPLEQLEDMFREIAEAGWDTRSDLLWGYFFTDPDPERLQPIATRLAELCYRFVSIFETDDQSTHFLHVEREESHSPESLFDRNLQFNSLAEEFDIESYDSMDVGPVTGETR
jgi:hypothetical protein